MTHDRHIKPILREHVGVGAKPASPAMPEKLPMVKVAKTLRPLPVLAMDASPLARRLPAPPASCSMNSDTYRYSRAGGRDEIEMQPVKIVSAKLGTDAAACG